MSFFSRRRQNPADRLEGELASLETQVQSASPGYETQFLNRAGNLCVEAGEPSRALGYYGRAIDAYLESGRFSAAEVLCRKILQIAPRVVRARCTLAWLALGKGHEEGFREEIREYVAAAQREERQTFAAKQLMMMAEAASSADLRQTIAEHLLKLEAVAEADRVFGLVFEARNGLSGDLTADEGKLWSKLLRAALMGPDELQQAAQPVDEEGGYLPSLSSRSQPDEP
jgi:hypothetical protein